MKKGIIYYTPNDLHPIIWEPCLKQLKKAWKGDVVSVSLKPLDFGDNYVMENVKKSYPTMIRQILLALQKSTADYVFFCEHDVLYHPSHFDFVPPTDHLYYYNINNYRWRWATDVAITYGTLHSLSGLCCNRETAVKHYKYRIEVMEQQKLDEQRWREPRWARKFGYEPGTKKRRRGGITNEDYEVRKSELPNIDIRHRGTFSHPKTFKREFINLPPDFTEVDVYKIPGWDLKELFDL